MSFVARCLAVLLFALVSVVPLHAAEPLIRVDILTPAPIVSGQQVQVQVDVLVPNFFMSAPQFPNFDIPNAVVTLPDVRAVNLVETIGGESFSGIRRLYFVTPQAPGDYVLPPATITFAYAAVPGQATKGSVTLPPAKFTVAGVPGAPAGNVAAATALTVTQTVDPEPKGLKTGDTLVRTVTVSAQGMQAMMIPVPDFTAPDGVRIYPHDPVLSDQEGSGKRVDRVTYAFEKPGSYVLPAVEVGWYDPASQKHATARAPEISVSVADVAAFKPAIAPPPAPEEPAPAKWKAWLKYWPWFVAVAVALAALAWLVTTALPRLHGWRHARRLEHEQSEPAYFQRLEEACRAGRLPEIYSALDSWSRRAGIAPVSMWLRQNGDEAAQQELARFESAIFAAKPDSTPCNPQKLLGGLAPARKRWLASHAGRTVSSSALPALNP
ncbi:BatD family protein [Aminobacter sp. AP02]|uniref:BatD family protein n=1 Tax=Aminobacter sp. AP02 TaxID=2135737 RepID=UPI000D6BDE37|nr:BatD family protein [Aminobacter sp. AP02]PWK68481.1 oxygen tolerance protein BatD [Aminobacter sp. AP02]